MVRKALTVMTALGVFMAAALPTGALAKTVDDFTDLQGVDIATKAKLETLIQAGVFQGVSEERFGLKDTLTRAQFAKVLALILNLKVDDSLTKSSFKDVVADDPGNGYALPYIEALKQAGIATGNADGTFNPAGTVTKEQLAAFLIRGLGKEGDAKATPGVSDNTVSDWAKGYVALALQIKLLHGSAGDFQGDAATTRDELIEGVYESGIYYDRMQPFRVVKVKQTGASRLQVSLSRPKTNEEFAFKVVSKKYGEVTVKAVEWSGGKATLILDRKLEEDSYDITLTGTGPIDEKYTQGSAATQPEKLMKIEFAAPSNTVAWAKEISIDFVPLNQFGEVMDLTADDFDISSSKDLTTVKGKPSVLVYSSGSPLERGDLFSISIMEPNGWVAVTRIFTIGDPVIVGKLESKGITDSTGKATDSLMSGEQAYWNFTAYNQYGSPIRDLDVLRKYITVTPDKSQLKFDGMSAFSGDPAQTYARLVADTSSEVQVKVTLSGSSSGDTFQSTLTLKPKPVVEPAPIYSPPASTPSPDPEPPVEENPAAVVEEIGLANQTSESVNVQPMTKNAKKLYYAVIPAADAPTVMTADEVKNYKSAHPESISGDADVASTAENTKTTVTLSNLSPKTKYKIFVVAENGERLLSEVKTQEMETRFKFSLVNPPPIIIPEGADNKGALSGYVMYDAPNPLEEAELFFTLDSSEKLSMDEVILNAVQKKPLSDARKASSGMGSFEIFSIPPAESPYYLYLVMKQGSNSYSDLLKYQVNWQAQP
ncbi:S-layer homology domain-containing protein [Paenibacillus cellulositrophicus]|uniref:S-layer homology domain-containing protein n=1 Tax=Paenibacillus cellulositrophicus TaxID=562959 RepID=UPI00142F109C|nr:S-layer homology domain-containing protein [Paenibacillus cellulositrophicus]